MTRLEKCELLKLIVKMELNEDLSNYIIEIQKQRDK